MSFKVGDRVVCVEPFLGINEVTKELRTGPIPEVGVVYTVREINNGKYGLGIWLEELFSVYAYVDYKFRKLDESDSFKSNSLSRKFAQEALDSNSGDGLQFDPTKEPSHTKLEEQY